MKFLNIIFVLYSRLINFISKIYIPVFLRAYILFIVAKYFLKIKNLQDFNLKEYKNIKAFFIRKIKTKEIDIEENNTLIAPCDGRIIDFGIINEIKTKKIKQSYFDFNLLLDKDDDLINKHINSTYVTIYLAPYNYHRFHAPSSGTINYLKRINGTFLPVNPYFKIPNIFSINERVILGIDDILLIFVGASGVREIFIKHKLNENIKIGEELGYFGLGSTIILISKNFNFNAKLLNKDISALETLPLSI